MKTLGAGGGVGGMPWNVTFVDSKDGQVRIYAGLYLSNIVEGHQLKRRVLISRRW